MNCSRSSGEGGGRALSPSHSRTWILHQLIAWRVSLDLLSITETQEASDSEHLEVIRQMFCQVELLARLYFKSEARRWVSLETADKRMLWRISLATL